MKDYKKTPEALYEKTNDGLDIIHRYVPQSVGCEANRNKKFKFRDEKDPSATLFHNGNCWFVVDFGGKSYSPISVVQYFLGLDFYETLSHLYNEFHLSENKISATAIVEITETNLPLDYFKIEVRKNYTSLKKICRFLTDEVAQRFHFYEVDFFERIYTCKETGKRKKMKIQSTENYPIFCYSPNLNQWAKLYCPKDAGKFKHSYLGKAPSYYLHGLDYILSQVSEDYINELRGSKSPEAKEELNEELLENIVICSGGSDGMSLASLSDKYFPVWLNSEKQMIDYKDYKRLKNLCKNLYNLPDIDKPGKIYAYDIAQKYYNLKTIWLPKSKMLSGGKDFRDFLDFYAVSEKNEIISQFEKVKNLAIPCNFIEENYSKNGVSYSISLVKLHYFLNVNGFYTYLPKNKTDILSNENNSLLVYLDNFRVEVPNCEQIRHFCMEWLSDKKGTQPPMLEMLKRSAFFTEFELKKMNSIELNFTHYTRDSQIFFFKNKPVKVSDKGIELIKDDNVQNFVWENKIINHNIRPMSSFFEYYIDESGNNRVKILKKDCQFMNYLINGSRVFWKKELEDFSTDPKEREFYFKLNQFNLNGVHLSENEHMIQEQHFLSKVFAAGYLLHRYKDESFAKFVYIMDDTPKETEDEAEGGTGKSLFVRALKEMIQVYYLDGKNTIETNNHLFGGVTESTDLVCLDDGNRYFDFTFFYSKITGSLFVNPKQKQGFELPFDISPKFAGSFNYGFSKSNGSDLRRLFFISFSDYYHAKTDKFEQERRVADDFGLTFFRDWNNDEWNNFYNFLLQCLQFYLANKQGDFQAPSNNIIVSNLKSSMGDSFLEWAEMYFSEDKFNKMLNRKEMYEDYVNMVGKNRSKTSQKFRKSLIEYCKLYGYEFNPKEFCGSDGKIRKNMYVGQNRTSEEFFYIRTPKQVSQENPQNEVPF